MEQVLLDARLWALIAVVVFIASALGSALLVPFRYAYFVRRLFGRRVFGSARWARRKDLTQEGLTGREGLFLGRAEGRDLFDAKEGHLITIAAPGAGKSSGLVVPTLLEGRHGSFLVADPSGELAAMTRRHRATIGPVALFNPWPDDFEADTGLSMADTGFNPLSVIQKGPNLVDDARAFAKLMMVTDRVDSGSYWNQDGARLLAGLIVWIKTEEPRANQTLSFLFECVYDAALATRLTWMATHKDPYLQAIGNKFTAMQQDGPAQWQGVVSKAQGAVDTYAPGSPLGLHTDKSGFDLSSIKRDNATVYLLVPSGRMKVAQPWLNLMIGLAGMQIGRPGPARSVTVLLDETPALGFIPDLRDFMRQYRKAGLRMWIFSQTASALASPELYGREGFNDLLGLTRIKQFFSVEEPDVQELVSKLCGQKTVANVTANTGGAGVGDVGVPLVSPQAVRGLRKGQQIIICGGLQFPILGELVPYFKNAAWRGMVDRNPYRN